ncbi:hypothetical protein LTR56_001460 [Elasticomyces elasticus]|nr:hypothetical protein LTR56_001460 [Elasticomyces elasticus]KAK3668617.1 hypothetical protein LTR22_000504 [Elasticomyces elasticus]KAK4931969.1 hypothetical protein LTR49_001656 [Elasticomyces elasticus]KAK5768499.1 hypothetical protein LTS12_001287 [Elasticomyces elasticus]
MFKEVASMSGHPWVWSIQAWTPQRVWHRTNISKEVSKREAQHVDDVPSTPFHASDLTLTLTPITRPPLRVAMGQIPSAHKINDAAVAAGSLGKAAEDARPAIKTVAGEMEKDHGREMASDIAAGASSGAMNASAPTLQMIGKYAALATSATATTTTLVGAGAVNHFRKLAVQMDESLKGMCDAAEISANLKHESEFPRRVYDFVSYQVSKATGADGGLRDLDTVVNHHGPTTPMWVLPEIPRVSSWDAEEVTTPSLPKQFFCIYHPSNEWHGKFDALLRKKPIPDTWVTDNVHTLSFYLIELRTVLGPDAIINILVPSTHVYIITQPIHIGERLQPLRIIGQTHYSGKPYVYATITGMDVATIKGIGLLPVPNKISVANKIGAAIAGAGAGTFVCGAVVAGAGGPLAPLVLGSVTIAKITGGSLLGGLVGTVVGKEYKEWCRWAGTAVKQRREDEPVEIV